jgi:hypothetical protein
MSNVKDKLSANIRTVKSRQEPVTDKQARETSDKTDAEPAAEKPATPRKSAAPRKQAAPRKSAKKAPASGKTTVPGDVPESGTALFPSRVWPD